MSLFDAIRYPVVDANQATELFTTLPDKIRAEYMHWASDHRNANVFGQLDALRRIILEHEE